MDKLTLMRAYRAVVETGSFTAAGQRMARTKAMISRQISELEATLNLRLINRTTRKLSITAVGETYYQQCCRLLDDLEEMESALQQGHDQAKGLLRINAPQTFAELHLIDAINLFLTRYPDVDIDLRLNDRFVDIVEEGFDLGIRIAHLNDSSFIARKFGEVRIIVCASPQYLKIHGTPKIPEELTRYNCIVDSNVNQSKVWTFTHDQKVTVKSSLSVNSAVAVCKAMLADVGIGRCPSFAVEEAIATGQLVPLLESYEREARGLYAIYPHRKHLAAKVRLFVDFLVGQFSKSNNG